MATLLRFSLDAISVKIDVDCELGIYNQSFPISEIEEVSKFHTWPY